MRYIYIISDEWVRQIMWQTENTQKSFNLINIWERQTNHTFSSNIPEIPVYCSSHPILLGLFSDAISVATPTRRHFRSNRQITRFHISCWMGLAFHQPGLYKLSYITIWIEIGRICIQPAEGFWIRTAASIATAEVDCQLRNSLPCNI